MMKEEEKLDTKKLSESVKEMFYLSNKYDTGIFGYLRMLALQKYIEKNYPDQELDYFTKVDPKLSGNSHLYLLRFKGIKEIIPVRIS